MTATQTNTRHASYAKPFGRFVVIALFAVSLITTGCDFVDSNAVTDAPHEEARLLESPSASMLAASMGGPLLGPPDVAPPDWHDLVGTWQYVEAGVLPNKTVTFTLDQRVRVETECQTHGGPFSSESQGQLSIAYLQVIDQTCSVLAEEPLIRMLEAATAYKVQDGQLSISSGWDQQTLLFNTAATTAFSEKEEVSILGPPAVAPGEDDHHVGPPDVDDEASEKPEIIGPPEREGPATTGG